MANIPVLGGVLVLGVRLGAEPVAEFHFLKQPECSICNIGNETKNKHDSFYLLKEIDLPCKSEWEYPDSLNSGGPIYRKCYFLNTLFLGRLSGFFKRVYGKTFKVESPFKL